MAIVFGMKEEIKKISTFEKILKELKDSMYEKFSRLEQEKDLLVDI
jgi:hypothetical protein